MSQEQPIIERRRSGFMRHGEAIVSALILAGLLAIAGLIFRMNDSVLSLLTKVEVFEQKFTVVEARFDKYQTKEAARAAWEAQALRDEMAKARVEQLERSILREKAQ